MPMLIPTPDELQHLSPAKRAKILRVVRSILMEADDLAGAAAKRAAADRAEGERIRAEARDLLAATPPEPAHLVRARRLILTASE